MLLKVEKRWVIAFIITAIVAMVSLFWPTKLPDASSGVFLEENNLVGADIAWLLASSGLVLLMTPGLSFFYGGMVGKKNVISTMLQSFIALGVISLVWVVVGFFALFRRFSRILYWQRTLRNHRQSF